MFVSMASVLPLHAMRGSATIIGVVSGQGKNGAGRGGPRGRRCEGDNGRRWCALPSVPIFAEPRRLISSAVLHTQFSTSAEDLDLGAKQAEASLLPADRPAIVHSIVRPVYQHRLHIPATYNSIDPAPPSPPPSLLFHTHSQFVKKERKR